MKLYELAEISLQVTRNASRLTKIGHLAECLRRLEPGEIPIAVAYLCGELPQGKIGIGWSMLKDTLAGPASGSPALTLGRDRRLLRNRAADHGLRIEPAAERALRRADGAGIGNRKGFSPTPRTG